MLRAGAFNTTSTSSRLEIGERAGLIACPVLTSDKPCLRAIRPDLARRLSPPMARNTAQHGERRLLRLAAWQNMCLCIRHGTLDTCLYVTWTMVNYSLDYPACGITMSDVFSYPGLPWPTDGAGPKNFPNSTLHGLDKIRLEKSVISSTPRIGPYPAQANTGVNHSATRLTLTQASPPCPIMRHGPGPIRPAHATPRAP